jgi:hypothetical protein
VAGIYTARRQRAGLRDGGGGNRLGLTGRKRDRKEARTRERERERAQGFVATTRAYALQSWRPRQQQQQRWMQECKGSWTGGKGLMPPPPGKSISSLVLRRRAPSSLLLRL